MGQIFLFGCAPNWFGQEQNILDFLQDKIDTLRFGKKRFDEKTRQFRFKNTDEDKQEAIAGLKKVRKLFEQNYFLIICDEIINCLNLDLIDELVLRDFIDACPTSTHLILTGRNVPEWLKEKADLVSEVKEIKHYFRKGTDAIKGLDY